MRAIEDALVIARPTALPHEPNESPEEEDVRDAYHHLAPRPHELDRPLKGSPWVDQVLEDVRRDQTIERRLGWRGAGQERLGVRDCHAVDPLLRNLGVARVDLDAHDRQLPRSGTAL
jgi:hypothetical protein